MFSRYAEGYGTAAKFNKLTGLAFLSPTMLIFADLGNHCLRFVDFTTNPPSTTRFAGKCKTSGFVQGHRLYDARIYFPKSIAVSNNNLLVYFVENDKKSVHEINLESDELKLVKTFSEELHGLLFYNNALYATLNSVKVIKINVETSADENIAGGNLTGNATGLFSETRFKNAQEFICWPDSQERLLLVADKSNKRFVKNVNQTW